MSANLNKWAAQFCEMVFIEPSDGSGDGGSAIFNAIQVYFTKFAISL